MKWKYKTGGSLQYNTPVIGTDGTIYIGSQDDYLYALTDNGTSATLKWRYKTGGAI